MANLHPEKWTKTQLQDGFNKSRKLQEKQALKLHEEAQVEINDYGNDQTHIFHQFENTYSFIKLKQNIIFNKLYQSMVPMGKSSDVLHI